MAYEGSEEREKASDRVIELFEAAAELDRQDHFHQLELNSLATFFEMQYKA